jgi:GT2 family glycosyltransferase
MTCARRDTLGAPASGPGDQSRARERVSVVVITHNRVDELLRSLGRLTRLAERPRIVLVDNASTDGTVHAVLQTFPDVDVIALPDNRGSAARNVGVAAVDTPYVAFSDDDSWWAAGSLSRATDILDADPRLAVVNGHILVGEEQRDDPVCLDMAQSPLPARAGQPGHPLMSFVACAVVIRRTAFQQVGGYLPELMVGGEEEVLGWDLAAAGWTMSYIPEIVVHHHPSSARDVHERRARQLKNALWTTWLRRPAAPACRRTIRVLASAPPDTVTARGLAGALAGLPWVLRRRRTLPPHVEQMRRLLDDSAGRAA